MRTIAKTKTFDNAIARASRKAAKFAKLNYGQASGFTCHSFRHTFVARMMEATGNDVGLVMSYGGHRLWTSRVRTSEPAMETREKTPAL